MPFIFPQSQKQATETAGQILTYGFAREVLGYCLRTLHHYYDLLPQIEAVEGVATATATKTLNDTRIAVENLYNDIGGRADNEVPTGSDQSKINGYLYLSGYTCRSLDPLTGEGWAADLMDTVAYAWNKSFGAVLDRALNVLDAASKIPQLSLDSAGDILKSLGSLGWIAMVVLVLLAVGVAGSLFKGKVPS